MWGGNLRDLINADPGDSVRQGRHAGRFPAHLGAGDPHRADEAQHRRHRGLRATRHGESLRPRGAAPAPRFAGGDRDNLRIGKLWAQALGIPVTPQFIDHIDALFFQETLDHLTPMGDVAALLGQLRVRGYRLRLVANDADANTRAQLRELGLDELLEFIAAYDSGYGHKPDPAPVLAFAQFAGLAPAEIAVVGDTEHDLVAARAAGATAVGVLSGPVPRERLAPHADVLLPSIAKLDDWLSSISAKG